VSRSSKTRRWILRNDKGHVEGPFTTEAVLAKIACSEITGEESVAHFPDGKWIPISQDPQFYDKLLEVLERENANPQETVDDSRIIAFSTDAAPPPPPRTSRAEPVNVDEPTEPMGPPKVEVEAPPRSAKKKRRKSRKRREDSEDIELIDSRPQMWKAIVRRALIPLGLVLLAGAAVLMLVNESLPVEDRIHLIAPQKNVAQVKPENLQVNIRQGVSEFLKDTFPSYLRAQNDFIYVSERNIKNAEVMALLCMTYLQLWPYAYQDSVDAKAVSAVVQMSAAVDPGGPHASACRAVDLILRARFQEAKSLVEAVLEARANEPQPPILFYLLKGLLLEGEGDHASAVVYFQSAQRLWPQWLLAYVLDAQALAKMEKYGPAVATYTKVLNSYPSHRVARIELGLLEYKQFNQVARAEQSLRQGLDGDQAPKPILSRGYVGLAELALRRNDQREALALAQKAFSLNSSNTSAKNLIVQLGGVEKLKSTKIKGQQLIFEGDQFFREGDCHAAQAHYKAAFEEDPKNAQAAVKAAQCLWKLSFSTEALEWLNQAIRADPKQIEAYVTLADYHAQRYNFMMAVRVLEQARQVNPKSHEVFRGFANIELKRGNPSGALAYGKRAQKLYENDVETQIILAQAALVSKDPKMAFNYASKAVELDINHRQAQIVYAQALAGVQGIDVGVDYFLRLITNYPLVSDYRLALGRLLMSDERYPQAEEVFRQIAKLDEKPKAAYVELSRVLRAQGQTNEALDLLLKAAVLDPSDAEPLYLAGTIYLELRKPQEAALQFQRVITINKLFPLVNYQLGRAALLIGDPRMALSFAELEKKANPNLADAYLLAAEAHASLQQYSNCASEYQRAIKLRPQQAGIYVRLAQCYRKVGILDTAVAMLNVAASKESGLAEIYKEQGAIYELKSEINKAIEAYNQYFSLDPDAPDRAQIEERISALQRGQRP